MCKNMFFKNRIFILMLNFHYSFTCKGFSYEIISDISHFVLIQITPLIKIFIDILMVFMIALQELV